MQKTSSEDPTPVSRSKRKRASNSSMEETDVFLAMALHLSPIHPNAPNMVFSPLCLRALLSLCAAGSNAPTAQHLLFFLKSDSIDNLNALSKKLFSNLLSDSNTKHLPKLSLTSGVWIHKGLSLSQSFEQVVNNVYKTDLHRSDFANQAPEIESEVNSWVKEKTEGLILEIMPSGSVSKTDRLIFVNALYFKANWSSGYFKQAEYTEDYDFHLLDGKSVKVPFMTSGIICQSIGIFDNFKALRIDYKGGYPTKEVCMYILLPNSVDGLGALAERVCSEPEFLTSHLSSENIKYRHVDVGKLRVPKFKFSFGFEATDILKELGVTLPFKVGALSEMLDSPEESQELFVKDIHQKAFIEVNEEGTTAAAASMVMTGGGRPKLPRKKVEFIADHPFMFLIREENSGAVLFLGHVLNPLKDT